MTRFERPIARRCRTPALIGAGSAPAECAIRPTRSVTGIRSNPLESPALGADPDEKTYVGPVSYAV